MEFRFAYQKGIRWFGQMAAQEQINYKIDDALTFILK